jgi:hypothetical protein
MPRKLFGRSESGLFSPLIDVVLCILGAILVLLMVYIYLFRHQHDFEPPPALQFLEMHYPLRAIAGTEWVYTMPVADGTTDRVFDYEGALPAGLDFDTRTGTFFGTPQSPGSTKRDYALAVNVRDRFSSAHTEIKIEVYPAAVPFDPAENPLRIVHRPGALPRGRVGREYGAVLGALGGIEPYEFVVTEGALPPGLSLTDSNLSGVPMSAGTFEFRVVAQQRGGEFQFGSRSFRWEGDQSAPASFSIEILARLNESPSPVLPLGRVGEQYVAAVDVGLLLPDESVTWDGARRLGLSPLVDGRVLVGSPTSAGEHALTLAVRSGTSEVGSSTSEIRILPPLSPSVGGVVFQIWVGDPPVSYAIPVRGLLEPVTVRAEGSLPDGLDVTNEGRIVGAGTEVGVHTVDVVATDARGREAMGAVEIRIGPRF